MASQAIKHKLFEAAVVFFDVLKRTVSKEYKYHREKSAIFGNFHVSYQQAHELHQNALKIHDKVLLHKGQYGMLHVCRDQPYDATIKSRKALEIFENVQYILDRDNVYRFKAKERIKRTRLGRKKWVGEFKIPQKESQSFQKTTMIQINRLCNGQQIKVNTCTNEIRQVKVI